jgi:hypothetical protein
MSVAKVIEIMSEGESIEKAIEAGVAEVAETVRHVQGAYVEGIKAIIEDGKIKKYRVDLKITFVVDR